MARAVAREAGCAPHVSAWLERLRDDDPYLRDECRIAMLGEVASVTVPHPVFPTLPDAPYRYHELLGAIWREPVAGYLEPGERARTMASLLLERLGRPGGRRRTGRPLGARRAEPGYELPARPAAAGAALPLPLRACFTPHGENVVLIFDEREVPVRIALKDFGADVELLTDDLPEYALLPATGSPSCTAGRPASWRTRCCRRSAPGVFRFFAPIVDRHLGVPRRSSGGWSRAEIVAYHERFGLTESTRSACSAPTFGRVSLNREQLLGGGFHDRSERDGEFDVIYGTLTNPLHDPLHREAGD